MSGLREGSAYRALRRAYRRVRRTRPYREAGHLLRLARDGGYKDRDRAAREAFERFRAERGGRSLGLDLFPEGGPDRTAVVVSQYYLPFAPLEAIVTKILQVAGFRTVAYGIPRYDLQRYARLAGVEDFYSYDDFAGAPNGAWLDDHLPRLRTLQDWLAVEYRGSHVGRFVIATVLRALRVGQLDFEDQVTRETLREALERSLGLVDAAARLFDELEPDCVVLMDRGYSGYGEIFDMAIQRGIDVVTWHPGYKRDRLLFKRHRKSNDRDHPLTPSDETWERLKAIPWGPEAGRRVRDEIRGCYETQEWFSVVGTQFGKEVATADEARAELGVDTGRKVAVVFPHILWDGSFFYGDDLFDDYTEWFAETMRVAVANPRIQWVVKLHPAHMVKARQQGVEGVPAELEVIRERIGSLPDHVTLVHPDTAISTLTLFEIADYVVTVRGTVGIEAAALGVPVVTGGTGRYDRRGFTVDSDSREEYLSTLERLDALPPPTAEQTELAERYAYGMLFWRTFPVSSVSLEYERDEKATPRVGVIPQTRRAWLDAPDVKALAGWFADGRDLDTPVLEPEEAEAEVEPVAVQDGA